ncbi:hypothetical protein WJX77_009943 [Trebouxia sp. C0004]
MGGPIELRASCASLVECNNKWSPLTIFAVIAGVIALSAVTTVATCIRVTSWYKARHGSLMVATASAGAAAVRKADPAHYPAAPHAYFRLGEHELTAPLLCAVCFERVEANNLFQRGSCCEVCGILAHESCARHVPDDCRPIALPAEKVLHTWKAAGTLMIESQDHEAAKPPVQSAICDATRSCTQMKAFKRHRSKSLDSRAASQPVKDGQPNGLGSQEDLTSCKKHKRQRSVEADARGITPNREQDSPAASGVCRSSSFSSTKQLVAGRLRSEKRTGSFTALMSALTSVVSGGVDAVADATVSNLPIHTLDTGVDVEHLDICHLGHHKRLVLPPTCTRLVPSESWTSRAKSLFTLPTKKKGKGGKGKGAPKAAGVKGQESVGAASTADSSQEPDDGHEEGAESQVSQQAVSGSQRRSTWWGPSELQWQNYRIADVPTRTKPLLVFVNTKSGPMLGHTLRRKFLRLLNPLQVVELPREGPEQALKLFRGLPNLRLLVIGGDGTVAWILSCIDSIQASIGNEDWVPPAIALLPLGTGNDLARCLNWGGGLGAFHSRGLSAVLQDIEQSTVALLDRWDIKIQPQTPPGKKSSKSQLKRTASKIQGRKEEPEKAEHKAMNNYLGIGVDAKAALDFHSLRTAYPNWFRSQVGNKLWYTGLGAREIVQHSVKQISKRLQVICDGEPLSLPDDIEGVLFLNINSYMGGVDLWASGYSSAGSARTGKQSFCDGMLEVVGVYGSWHLGQLQMDGEPWLQAPAKLNIELKGQAHMLRRLNSEPLARMAHTVAEVLDHCEHTGVITAAQRHAITRELAAKLHTD